MPVDLNIPNFILGNYIAGRNERLENQRFQLAQKRQQDEFNERIRQFNEKLAQDKEEFQTRKRFEEAKLEMDQFNARRIAQDFMARTGQADVRRMDTSPEAVEEFLKTGQMNEILETRLPSGEVVSVNPRAYFKSIEAAEIARQAPGLRSREELLKLSQPFELRKIREQAALREQESFRQRKFTEEQNKLNRDASMQRALIAAAARKASGSDKSEDLLTPEQAISFNVPYGTRKKDVFGKTPGKQLSSSEFEDIRILQELIDTSDIVENLGNKTNWDIFGSISGPTARIKSKFGQLDEQREELKQSVDRIIADVALMRGGKTITKTEEGIIKRVLPDIGAGQIKTKVAIETIRRTLSNAKNRILEPESLIKKSASEKPPTRKSKPEQSTQSIEDKLVQKWGKK
jgi:hypothetical protein